MRGAQARSVSVRWGAPIVLAKNGEKEPHVFSRLRAALGMESSAEAEDSFAEWGFPLLCALSDNDEPDGGEETPAAHPREQPSQSRHAAWTVPRAAKRKVPAAPPADTSLPTGPHVHLDDIAVSKFWMDAAAQLVLVQIQRHLLDKPYDLFGKVVGSWDRYNIVFPKSFGSDRRKPVSEVFQN